MPDQRSDRSSKAWFVTNGIDWYYVAPETHDLEKIVHDPDPDRTTTVVLKADVEAPAATPAEVW